MSISLLVTTFICIVAASQGVNIYLFRKIDAKVEKMVSDATCLERSTHLRRELHIVEKKMDRHVHNGEGTVKYYPYSSRD